MVDVKKTEDLFKEYFRIAGTYQIDPDSGVVDVQGGVGLKGFPHNLPVQFGCVSANFYCNHSELTSLAGAPRYVGGNFSCYYNQLTSLAGAPDHVGGDFICSHNKLTSLVGAPNHVDGDFNCYNNQLTSLSGAPDHVGGHFLITYGKDLPLLRLCGYRSVNISACPNKVQHIMNKYAGTGRPGALKAAAELIRAGYPNNAKW